MSGRGLSGIRDGKAADQKVSGSPSMVFAATLAPDWLVNLLTFTAPTGTSTSLPLACGVLAAGVLATGLTGECLPCGFRNTNPATSAPASRIGSRTARATQT